MGGDDPGSFSLHADGGDWQSVEQGLSDRNVVSLEEAPNGSILAGTRFGRVFRLDDPQGSWTELTQPTATTISDLASRPGQPAVIYAATEGAGLLMSGDGGEHWQTVEGLENPYPSQIRFSKDGRRLYVASAGGVYEMTLQAIGGLGSRSTKESPATRSHAASLTSRNPAI